MVKNGVIKRFSAASAKESLFVFAFHFLRNWTDTRHLRTIKELLEILLFLDTFVQKMCGSVELKYLKSSHILITIMFYSSKSKI